MTYNYKKSDDTLKMQIIRMQLETIAYCRIKLGKSGREILGKMISIWDETCKAHGILPENNFLDEYLNFEKETLLKFAPAETLANTEEKAILKLKGMNYTFSFK